MTRLGSSLAGFNLASPVMNGAYIGSKITEDIEKLAESAAGAVVVGSITVQPRRANENGGYWLHKEGLYSLNSFGMPNGGLEYFAVELPRMVATAHKHNKPLIANVAGFSIDEWVTLVQLAEDCGADMVELNLGCPNVWERGEQERIISYQPAMVHGIVATLAKENFSVPIGVKVSPLPPDILKDIAAVITKSGVVKFVTATNSYPNASHTTGTGDLRNGVLSGLAGRSLKPISLGVVRQLRALLSDDIAIVGCGGVSTTSDVHDYIAAGAVAVQVASGLMDNGIELFDILKSL